MLDVSDPSAPFEVASWDSPGEASGIAVTGHVAFVADALSGLQTVEIAHRVTPAILGAYDTVGNSIDVTVTGNVAWLAYGGVGMEALDVSAVPAVVSLGIYDTPNFATEVTVDGDVAYVSDNASGLVIVDVSDPAAPALLGTWPTPAIARAAAVAGDVAYVAVAAAGLQAIDVSDPTNPALLGSWNSPGEAYDVAVAGDVAYVADRLAGLQIVDVSDPTSLSLLGTFDTPGDAQGVAVDGSVVYVADQGWGLRVVNVTNPAAPTFLGKLEGPTFARRVDVHGDLVYLANGSTGLEVIDVSNPAAPVLVGNWNTSSFASGVAVSGDVAYVADSSILVQFVQVAQRKHDLDGDTGQSLAVDGTGHAIVRSRLSATQAGSVSWELTADGGGAWDGVTPNGSWSARTVPGSDLRWRATLAWSVAAAPSVSQLSIDWRTEPAVIDSIADVPEDAGGWVSVFFTRSGYDFAEEAGTPITSYVIERQAAGAAAGTWEEVLVVPAAQADAYAGAVPTHADSGAALEWTVYRVVALTAQPSVFFVSDPDSGYSVADGPTPAPSGDPAAFEIGAAHPNPFVTRTSVSFGLPAAGTVRVVITDVAGRRVRTLAHGLLPAGRHVVRWDGRDDGGTSVASGVYFLVVEAAERQATRKVALVRD
jgi:hypothetical protein